MLCAHVQNLQYIHLYIHFMYHFMFYTKTWSLWPQNCGRTSSYCRRDKKRSMPGNSKVWPDKTPGTHTNKKLQRNWLQGTKKVGLDMDLNVVPRSPVMLPPLWLETCPGVVGRCQRQEGQSGSQSGSREASKCKNKTSLEKRKGHQIINAHFWILFVP